MSHYVSIIIPAWNEEKTIGATLQALRKASWPEDSRIRHEIIVVDDGSDDQTYIEAWPLSDRLIRHARRRGKGTALASGIAQSRGDIYLFLDGDLQGSAEFAPRLLSPILSSDADLVIAKLPPARTKGGFGFVKALARCGIYSLSGYKTEAPLSGQRALRADGWNRLGGLASGFGTEVGMTIDAARAGLRIQEIDVPFLHRETQRDWHGFLHRGKQFAAVGAVLLSRWKGRNRECVSDRSLI